MVCNCQVLVTNLQPSLSWSYDSSTEQTMGYSVRLARADTPVNNPGTGEPLLDGYRSLGADLNSPGLNFGTQRFNKNFVKLQIYS